MKTMNPAHRLLVTSNTIRDIALPSATLDCAREAAEGMASTLAIGTTLRIEYQGKSGHWFLSRSYVVGRDGMIWRTDRVAA